MVFGIVLGEDVISIITMGKIAADKAVVELIVRILVRVILAFLAGIGLGDIIGEEAVAQAIEAFLTHLVTAALILLSLWDLFRKPENREKVQAVLGKGKFLFEKALAIFLEDKPQQ